MCKTVTVDIIETIPMVSLFIKRILRKVAYMQPLKLQASLQGHDLMRKHKLVDVGHRFGKVGVLATMLDKFYLRKLERTLNADRLKFNGRLVQINMNLISGAIVAFVCSSLGKFCKSRKL